MGTQAHANFVSHKNLPKLLNTRASKLHDVIFLSSQSKCSSPSLKESFCTIVEKESCKNKGVT
jgi:hypothetical protein